MTNENLYTVVVQHYSNSGLGWEPMAEHMGGVDVHDLTRQGATALATTRDDIRSSSVTNRSNG